jgi:hypothetical protein
MNKRRFKTLMIHLIIDKKVKKKSRGILQLKTRINFQLRNKKRILKRNFLKIKRIILRRRRRRRRMGRSKTAIILIIQINRSLLKMKWSSLSLKKMIL